MKKEKERRKRIKERMKGIKNKRREGGLSQGLNLG